MLLVAQDPRVTAALARPFEPFHVCHFVLVGLLPDVCGETAAETVSIKAGDRTAVKDL